MALGTAYDGAAATWETGPGAVFRPLARLLVASSPTPLAGRLVLDVGSGTGSVAEAAQAAGARVVATDRSRAMVAVQAARRATLAADVIALPFRDGAFDAALAGFVLNHLAPGRALCEMARVLRPGGLVLASTWAGGAPDPVKSAIDEVLTRWGWVPPGWYREMMAEVLPVSGDAARLASAAERAGLLEVTATARAEDLGVRDPRTVVAYRLAVAQVGPWVATLDAAARVELTRAAVEAVTRLVGAWRPVMVVVSGRVAAQPRRRADRCNAGA